MAGSHQILLKACLVLEEHFLEALGKHVFVLNGLQQDFVQDVEKVLHLGAYGLACQVQVAAQVPVRVVHHGEACAKAAGLGGNERAKFGVVAPGCAHIPEGAQKEA